MSGGSSMAFTTDTKSSTASGGGGGGRRECISFRSSIRSSIRSSVRSSIRSSSGGRSGSRDSVRSNSKSGSGAATEIVQNREDHEASKAYEIQRMRILLGLSLMVLAGVLGTSIFYFFRFQEDKLGMEQFYSIAMRATHYAQHATQMKRSGVVTMATMIGVAHPNASEYPFVLVDGYDEISSSMVETIFSEGMGFAPIVTPEELDAFEEFAYDSYYNTLGYPNETAVESFGRGVYAKMMKTGHKHPVNRVGDTMYGSPYKIYTPILQHSDAADANCLLNNLHHGKFTGETIDKIINCSLTRIDSTTQCGQMSDLVVRTLPQKAPMHGMHEMDHHEHHVGHEAKMIKAPTSFIMQPIHPIHNPEAVTAIVSSPFVWQDSLDSAFGSTVCGVHCVLTSSTGKTFTYRVKAGQVSLIGEGDSHETKFDDQEISIDLINEASGLYSADSLRFTLKLYPSEEFMDTYHTKNPIYGTIIIVSVMLFLTMAFCLYDWYVKREFDFKNELLEAKRNFIRFVSHEVRTPLNAVCMGLMLMREEIDSVMKGTDESEETEVSDSSNNTQKSEGVSAVSQGTFSEWKGVTDEILENSQNAVGVLNDLLNYDKITTGSLKLELSLLKTDMLMDHAQKEIKLPAAKKNIDVEFEDNISAPYRMNTMCIVGDDVRLIQVLRNLMSNALKFTPPKGKVKVSISWVQELREDAKNGEKRQAFSEPEPPREFTLKMGKQVALAPSGFLQLRVADTGAGMSTDQMANVFEQGTQFNVNELQCGQGSGLGLYIAKGIMDQHLGSLTVFSEGLGKGTTFTMSVPVYSDPARNKDESCKDIESDHFTFSASKAMSPNQMEGVSKLRILVVDDSDMNRKFLVRILQNRGHICDQARDGDIAVKMVAESMKGESIIFDSNSRELSVSSQGDLESALGSDESGHYDAVLLDYEMPIMNGPTAANKMRQLGSDTFIVGITGNLMPEDVDYFREQGANEVLPKPFNISDLEEILMEYGVGFRDNKEEEGDRIEPLAA